MGGRPSPAPCMGRCGYGTSPRARPSPLHPGTKTWGWAIPGQHPMGGRPSPAPRMGRCGCGTWAPAQTERPFNRHQGWVVSVAVTPDGRQALSGSADKTLRLWDLATGQTLHTFTGHQDVVLGGSCGARWAAASPAPPIGRCACGTWRAARRLPLHWTPKRDI